MSKGSFYFALFSWSILLSAPLYAQIEFVLEKNKKFDSHIDITHFKNKSELAIDVTLPNIQLYPFEKNANFVELGHEQLQLLQNPGEPKVPFVATLVNAYPEDLEVDIVSAKSKVLKNSLIAPAQKEPCRCESDIVEKFIFHKNAYKQQNNLVNLEYLGKYRGIPITRILVKLAKSDYKKNFSKIYSKVLVKIQSKQRLNSPTLNIIEKKGLDYLVVGPPELTIGLSLWKTRKEALGFTFKVVNIDGADALDNKLLDTIFKTEYKKNKFQYALLVGDVTKLGTNLVTTQWSTQTQSDYQFFLMDGKRDIIPDVQYGRVVASTVDDVVYQANKWINYELEQTLLNRGLSSMIGIASNEGANPSDDEYVRSIETMLENSYGTRIQHFHQDDLRSNPVEINAAFKQGAHWLTYMGHGSGKSWGSTNKLYDTTHIKDLKNFKKAQPILIDVACQNGRLNQGYFGERMVNEGPKKNYFWRDNNIIGAALYYGGSVNISWHPPAIMAKGMVEEQIKQNLHRVGDIILAGHLYLMNNYSDLNAVKENFAWYHLFGDPSTKVNF